MQLFQGLLLIFFGAGLLLVARRGWRDGEIPAGAYFLRGRFLPSRRNNPLVFHLFVLLYIVLGLWLGVYGLQILTGSAEPLPLR